MSSLCRYTASRALAAMRGLFFCHIAPAVCRPPAIAQAAPHLRHPIRGLFFQHINRVIGRPPALRQVLPPTRHYCTFPPRPVTHFTYRYSRWYYDPRKVAVATVPLIGIGIGIGGAVIADYGYIETVPYTNRTHFVLRSPPQEREVAETRFACLKEENADVILDAHHPDTVRVNNITSKLLQAVHSHLIIKSHDTVDMLHRGKAGSAMEVLKRKLGNARRAAQPATGHLNGLNWEVMVVEDERVTAWCFPAGKIVVPTGLLDFFKTDAEVAFMIAHEIGHIVARHLAEVFYRNWLPRPLWVPFLRRVEREADHIGMMLLGAAGFDPRMAPLAFEKLGDSNRGFLSTHPSNKKRSQLLSQTKIMEEALELYRQVSPDDRDTEGSDL